MCVFLFRYPGSGPEERHVLQPRPLLEDVHPAWEEERPPQVHPPRPGETVLHYSQHHQPCVARRGQCSHYSAWRTVIIHDEMIMWYFDITLLQWPEVKKENRKIKCVSGKILNMCFNKESKYTICPGENKTTPLLLFYHVEVHLCGSDDWCVGDRS